MGWGDQWSSGSATLTPEQLKIVDEVKTKDGVPVVADFAENPFIQDTNTGKIYFNKNGVVEDIENLSVFPIATVAQMTKADSFYELTADDGSNKKGLYWTNAGSVATMVGKTQVKVKSAGAVTATDFTDGILIVTDANGDAFVLNEDGDTVNVGKELTLYNGIPPRSEFTDKKLLIRDSSTGEWYTVKDNKVVAIGVKVREVDTVVEMTDKNSIYYLKADDLPNKIGSYYVKSDGTVEPIGVDTKIKEVATVAEMVDKQLIYRLTADDLPNKIGYYAVDTLGVARNLNEPTLIPEVTTVADMTEKGTIYFLKQPDNYVILDDGRVIQIDGGHPVSLGQKAYSGYYGVAMDGTVHKIGKDDNINEVATVAEMTDKNSIYYLTAKDNDNEIGNYYVKSDGAVSPIGARQSFKDLTDTPNDYTGLALQIMRVNATEDAMEAVELAATIVKYDDVVSNLGLPEADKNVQKAIEKLKQLMDAMPDQVTTDDIASRDALVDVQANTIVHVKDASADTTVTSGWCKYQYIDGAWFKYLSQEELNILDLNDLWEDPANENYATKGLTSFEQLDETYARLLEHKLLSYRTTMKFSAYTKGTMTYENSKLNTNKRIWFKLPNGANWNIDALTDLDVPSNSVVYFDTTKTEILNGGNKTISQAQLAVRDMDNYIPSSDTFPVGITYNGHFRLVSGQTPAVITADYDNATAWEATHDYEAKQVLYITPTEDGTTDKNGKVLIKGIRYFTVYPTDTTSGETLDSAEIAKMEVVNPPSDKIYDHILAVKAFHGSTFPTGVGKDEYVFAIDSNEIYKSNGDDSFSTTDKTKFNDYMELNVREPLTNYRFKKADGTFDITPPAAGLRGTPVADETELKALVAKEYERRQVKATKHEYVFKLTADLTTGENTDARNIADDAATGKWVYVFGDTNKLKYYEFAVYNDSGGNRSEAVFNATKKLHDPHDVYNLVTNEFTAPVDGVYSFNWLAFSNTEDGGNRTALYVDDAVYIQIGMRNDGTESDKHNILPSVDVMLTAGQRVQLRASVNNIHYYGAKGHNMFSGRLVTPEQEELTDPALVPIIDVPDDEIHTTDIRNGATANVTFAQKPSELKIGIRVWDGHMIYQSLSFTQLKAETTIKCTARGMNDKDNEHEDFAIQYEVSYVSDTEVSISVTDVGYLTSDNAWASRTNSDYRIEKVVGIYKATKTINKIDPADLLIDKTGIVDGSFFKYDLAGDKMVVTTDPQLKSELVNIDIDVGETKTVTTTLTGWKYAIGVMFGDRAVTFTIVKEQVVAGVTSYDVIISKDGTLTNAKYNITNATDTAIDVNVETGKFGIGRITFYK